MRFREKRFTTREYLKHYVTLPFIFGMLIPLFLLDICLELYHRISFFLYNIPRIKRRRYIRIDRHKLSYLSWYEKIFCAYCGYANGLLHYASTIAAETEKYWCGIKHEPVDNFTPPTHHTDFAQYNDEEDLDQRYPKAN